MDPHILAILSESKNLNSQRVKNFYFESNDDVSKMGRVGNYWENIYIP